MITDHIGRKHWGMIRFDVMQSSHDVMQNNMMSCEMIMMQLEVMVT